MEWAENKDGFKWIMNSEGCWMMIRHPDREKVQEFIQSLDKPQTVTIKPYKKKRGLNANKYAWALLEQLANVLRKSKDEMYIEMLMDYGQTAEDEEGNKIIFSVKSIVNVSGFYKYIAIIGTGTVNGENFTHYRALKGSSEFDTKEMSVFIDGIVSECKAQNIETMTPREIEELKRKWGEKEGNA